MSGAPIDARLMSRAEWREARARRAWLDPQAAPAPAPASPPAAPAAAEPPASTAVPAGTPGTPRFAMEMTREEWREARRARSYLTENEK